MIENLLVLLMLAQVILVFIVGFKMYKRRERAIKNGETTFAAVATDHSAWPEDCRKAQNSFANQFEIPVLFFAVLLLVLNFLIEDWFIVILAALFVISRYIHAFIHTGENHVMKRAKMFGVGALCVLVLWLYAVGKLLLLRL